MTLTRIILSVVVLALCSSAGAETRALRLAAQQSWGARQGFYMVLEGESDHTPISPGGVTLQLAVADGKAWRYVSVKHQWELATRYRAKAVITPHDASLYLNDVLIGKKPVAFSAFSGAFMINDTPSWQKAKADYMVIPHRFSISDSTGQNVTRDFEKLAARPMAIQLLSPSVPQKLQFKCDASSVITIESEFEFAQLPDAREFAPFVDRYGQPIAADYPGKIKNDADLADAWEKERQQLRQWGMPGGYDRFGGSLTLGWSEKATGFYRLTQRKGFWWLITPEGNPCYFIGLCGIPGLNWPPTPVTNREYLFAELPPRTEEYRDVWEKNLWGSDDGSEYVCFSAANMIRKYGSDWKNIARDLTAQRIRAWGFSGAGKWGGLFGDGAKIGQQTAVGCIGYLRLGKVPLIAGRPDVFDPAVQKMIEKELEQQMRPYLSSPWVLGWGVGNEYKEIIKPDDIRGILKVVSPAKRALIDHALARLYDDKIASLSAAWKTSAATVEELCTAEVHPSDNDVEQLRRYFADRYYALLHQTVKRIDPNHLYMGFWITPGWWVNENDWRLIAPHCDVIGYDRYDPGFAEPKFLALIEETNKPVLCGEFGFPTFYGGQRGYGNYRSQADDDAAAGQLYHESLEAAARSRYSVGMIWFDYRDQLILGRGGKNAASSKSLVIGENHAFGMVDLADRPKWDLVERVRAANLQAPQWRTEAAEKQNAQ